MMLVDLETAKRHLRVEDTASDVDLEDKIAQASGIIEDYVKRDLSAFAVDGSSHDEIPAPIKSATLEALRCLYDGEDPLNATVLGLLHRQRDPAMA
jgi:hypothetical protein